MDSKIVRIPVKNIRSMNNSRKYRNFVFLLMTALLFMLYFFFRSYLIRMGVASSIELIIEMLVILIFLFSIVVLLISAIITFFYIIMKKGRRKTGKWVKRVRNQSIFTVVILLLVSTLVYASQSLAYTPPIVSKNGTELLNSIASLEKVSLGNSEQWISIRGENRNNPIILFLAGGPGGSQMAATRNHLKELEKNFVIVNWDQPGAGKSYHSTKKDDLTPERYVEDAHQLTLYLTKDYFQKLQSPDKQLIWFEHSGHSPWINESEKFVDTVEELF